MKKIYSLILVVIALFAIQSVANAQPYTEKNHIAYSKYPTGPVDGIYTIHLDTFVTGEKTVTVSSLPADVVLVLDVSGSMSDSYTSYSYTARSSTGYTYYNYPSNNNNRYWYKHTDGNYYVVSRGSYNAGSWTRPSYRYYLQVNIGGTNYYLSGNQIVATRPSDVTSSTATIWTGVLYTRQTNTTTRLAALQEAVKDFIDVIAESDPGEAGKHNQISIVKFAGQYNGAATSSEETGNNRYTEDGYSYNYTEIVKGFTEVYDETTAENLKTYVTALNEGGATSADYGMNKALALINTLYENNGDPSRQSNKTVVFFTDGVPTHARRYDETVAVNAIKAAQTIKGKIAYHDDKKNEDVYVSVYSVGVFGSMTDTGMTETQRDTYMHRISSDYPNASGMGSTQGGTGGSDSAGYYQNASNSDLSSIFRTIASEAGGSQAQTVTAEAATTVDVVSQSFDLPYGADPNSIKVTFANCNGFANGYLTFDEEHIIQNPAEGEEGHVTIEIDEDTQKITASGFDYSGNWCGKDESLGENQYHGMKMMLEIPIEMSDDAVGGNAVGTNGPESGIYVDGKPVLIFDIPNIDLPTNLHIKKEDIANGECATFEIYRKPLTPSTSDWEKTPFKTVIVIGGNNNNTVKLMGLDPHYLYKIVEAGWSWSYDLDHVEDYEGNVIEGDITSDKLITNPFIFVNSKKATKVRHAESAVYNDFRTAGQVTGVDAIGQNKTETKTETETESGSK